MPARGVGASPSSARTSTPRRPAPPARRPRRGRCASRTIVADEAGDGDIGVELSELVVTHYDVLGVPPDAPLDDIKRAYYDRARLYHPDAHASSSPAVRAEAERTMQALNTSWSVLREPGRRHRYDRFLGRDTPVATASAGSTKTATASTSTSTATAVRAKGRVVDPRRTTRPVPERPARAALGVGFQYWFGAA